MFYVIVISPLFFVGEHSPHLFFFVWKKAFLYKKNISTMSKEPIKKNRIVKRKAPEAHSDDYTRGDEEMQLKSDSPSNVDHKHEEEKSAHSDASIMEMDSSETVTLKRSTKISQEKHASSGGPQLLPIFYSHKHYTEDVCNPHTIIVARDHSHARELLINELKRKYGRHHEKSFEDLHLANSPLGEPGVAILSIGLGELPIKQKKEFESTPIIRPYKSEASHPSEWKLFYCNSHYTSSITPAASIMIAKSSDEAALFLMQLLTEMSVTENPDLMVLPIDRTTPSVYFLCKDEREDTGTDFIETASNNSSMVHSYYTSQNISMVHQQNDLFTSIY